LSRPKSRNLPNRNSQQARFGGLFYGYTKYFYAKFSFVFKDFIAAREKDSEKVHKFGEEVPIQVTATELDYLKEQDELDHHHHPICILVPPYHRSRT
jgi:hypothetical protein